MRWIAGILFAVACIAQGPNYNSVINRPLTSATGSPYFARGNNVHDDLPAITAALVAANQVYLPPGHFVIHGKLTAIFANGRQLIGAGASNTFLECTDTSVSACLESAGGTSFANVLIQGITVNGRGKASGSGVRGISVHPSGAPYGLKLSDVRSANFSGEGIYIQNAFDSHYQNTWAEHTGSYGIVIGGDQSTTFINSGQYNVDTGNNGTYAWWFFSGDPFLQGLNADIDNGAKCARFGSTSGDAPGIQFAHPVIIGLNCETVQANGTGITFESGSNASFGTGITVYCGATPPATCSKGIEWATSMNNAGLFVPPPAIVSGSAPNNGTWVNRFYSPGGGFPNHGVTLFIGEDQSAGFNSEITAFGLIQQLIASTPSAGGIVAPEFTLPVVAPGLKSKSFFISKSRFVDSATATTDTIGIDDSALNYNTTTAGITATLHGVGFYPAGWEIQICRSINSTANTLTIATADYIGGVIGSTGATFTIPGQCVDLKANAAASAWIVKSRINWQQWNLLYEPGTVSGLASIPCAATANLRQAGMTSPFTVIDANNSTVGAVVTGGGSNKVLVECNGYTGHFVISLPLNN